MVYAVCGTLRAMGHQSRHVYHNRTSCVKCCLSLSTSATPCQVWPVPCSSSHGLRVRLASLLQVGSGVVGQATCQSGLVDPAGKKRASCPRTLCPVTPSARPHLTRRLACARRFALVVLGSGSRGVGPGSVVSGAGSESTGGRGKGTRTRKLYQPKYNGKRKTPIAANGAKSLGPIATLACPLGRARGQCNLDLYPSITHLRLLPVTNGSLP